MIEIYQEILNGNFYAYRKGDPNSNSIYGRGSSKDEAIRCLKIRLNQIKRK